MSAPRILIVEDQQIIAQDLHEGLQGFGYAVSDIVACGEDAVQKAAVTRPDVVLMDVRLHGTMDGIEAAAAIRSRYDIPVIYLTAYAEQDTVQRAALTHSHGYILKPFETKAVHAAIQVALSKHRSEQRLRDSERLLAATFSSIAHGIIVTDTRGSITYLNPAAASLTGWTNGEGVGRSLDEVFRMVDPQTRQPREVPAVLTTRPERLAHLTPPAILLARDGTEHLIADIAAHLFDVDMNLSGLVLVFKDVAESSELVADRLQLTTPDAVAKLTGKVVHDLNNLLTAILGNISLAKLNVNPGGSPHQWLTEAQVASMRGKDLMKDLVVFSDGGQPVKRTVNTANFLEDTVNEARLDPSTRCTYVLPESLPPVAIDRGQMRRVIHTLVRRAEHVMLGGGTLTIRGETLTVGAQTQDREVLFRPGRYVRLSFTDQGVGIPSEDLPKVFDPCLTPSQPDATGLGLTASYAIIINHGGQLTVDSQLGVGSTFSIILPAASSHGREEEPQDARPLVGQVRILVMEEDEAVRALLDAMLNLLGYDVESSRGGSEMLERYRHAQETGRPFAAVIIDSAAPGAMGGADAVQRLLSLDPRAKAIVTGGQSDDPAIAVWRVYGFSAVLPKPFTLSQLSQVLQHVIGPHDH